MWKIIEGSKLKPQGFDNIKTTTLKNGKYKNFADGVFGPKTNLGFVDLVADCNKKNSQNVKAEKRHVEALIKKINKSNIIVVGFLGKKVTKEFFRNLHKETRASIDNITYGLIYSGELWGCSKQIKIYCLPFPETTPMKRDIKIEYYNQLK